MTVTMKQAFLMGVAEALGFFVLIPACLLRKWTVPIMPSSKPYPSGTTGVGVHRAYVDSWVWGWLNAWYGNAEDGVSGLQAYVIGSKGFPVPYCTLYPTWVPQSIIAYGWSAWRNGAHALKVKYGVAANYAGLD